MSKPKVYIDKACWKEHTDTVANLAEQQFSHARFAIGPESLMENREDKELGLSILASVKSTFREQYRAG